MHLPNRGVRTWSDDVKMERQVPLIVTTARDSWDSKQALAASNGAALVLGWACQTRCS